MTTAGSDTAAAAAGAERPSAADVASAVEAYEFSYEWEDARGEKQTATDSGWSAWHEECGPGSQLRELGDGAGHARAIYEEGGGEGGTEHTMMVFEVMSEDGEVRHFVKEGAYYSHDGRYWDGDFFEAEQAEEVVTVWKRKKDA